MTEEREKFYATTCAGTIDGKNSASHRFQVKKAVKDGSSPAIVSPWITLTLLEERYPGIEVRDTHGICPDCWPKDQVSTPHPDLAIYQRLGLPYKED